ncbi:MAG: PIN domain-containing protein [Mycobacterium sp.]
MTARLPGTLYLIDTSAASRMVANPQVRTMIEALIDDGIVATCITLDLEAGFTGQKPSEVDHILHARRDHLVNLHITEAVENRAREVMTLLALRGLHRAAGVFDLLTAAVAEHHRAIILHYDADFEHIASVTGQRHQWIAPRGSID